MYEFANPQRFDALAREATPAIAVGALSLLAVGLFLALFRSPADYQQGESVRIMYVHVPAAWMALMCYSSMVGGSTVGFIWKHPLAHGGAQWGAGHVLAHERLWIAPGI